MAATRNAITTITRSIDAPGFFSYLALEEAPLILPPEIQVGSGREFRCHLLLAEG